MKNTTSTISMMGPSKNDKRPIAKFYRCWLEDISRGVPVQKCRGINLEQYEAADRLGLWLREAVYGESQRLCGDKQGQKSPEYTRAPEEGYGDAGPQQGDDRP